MSFKSSIFACLAIVFLVSCSKHSSPPIIPTLSTDSTLTVTMAANDGTVLSTMEADTFLVSLKDPATINTVPVVYHVGHGATLNVGHQLTDSTWSDTVDLSGSKVRMVKVTALGGDSKTWGLAFEYQVTYTPSVNPGYWANCIYFTGDTMYVGNGNGLYRSLDKGLTFNSISGLGNGVDVLAVSTSGNSIYAGTATGVSISNDGGMNFTEHVFPSWYQPGVNFPVEAVYKQADTLYVAPGNVDVSYDGGVSFSNNENGFGNLPVPISVLCLYAKGSTVYAGTANGFAVSYDGGKSFTINTSGLGSGNVGDAQCNAMAISNDTIYVGTESGVGLSTDGGLHFTEFTTANGLGGNVINTIAVGDGFLAAGTFYGLSLSFDAGKHFINFTTANGLGANFTNCVSIHNGVIYASTYDGIHNGFVTIKQR